MNRTVQSAAARLRRVFDGEYILDVYPQRPGMLQEEALDHAERDKASDEHVLAMAWLEDAKVRPDVVASG